MTRDVKAQLIDEPNVGALPVCNGNRLIGMITHRKITMRATAAGLAPAGAKLPHAVSDDARWCSVDDDVNALIRNDG